MKRQGTISEAAEKCPISRDFDGEHNAGAEAHPVFRHICGTTEVVP
jgi:hypothetical protein